MSLTSARELLARLCVLSGLGALACGGEQTEHTGRVRSTIFGGAPAPDDTAVVAVVNFAGGQCSGSLIAPQLVLSARHCIADTGGEDLKVVCGQSAFEEPDSPGAVFVVPGPEITDQEEDYHALSAIILPKDVGQDLCGTDEVLLVLKEPLTGITPLVPRVDQAVADGESYSAVGFGVDEAVEGRPSGVRKRSDDLEVTCNGQDCGMADIRANEWVGSGGPCPGDSGGPALDSEGRVIGVVSRGKDGCRDPVFGDVATRAEWLKSEAIQLANTAREQPPAWAPCDAEHACTYDDPPPDDGQDNLESSCAIGSRSRSGWSALLFVCGVTLVLRRRRRADLRGKREPPKGRPRAQIGAGSGLE